MNHHLIKTNAIIGFTLLMTGCVSNFGNHKGIGLRYENQATIEQKIIKGKTTTKEVFKMYDGFVFVENNQDDKQGAYCTSYHETKMPFYNFLPTNFLYMSSTRSHWKLCFTPDKNGIVQDYTFWSEVKKDRTVLSGFIE